MSIVTKGVKGTKAERKAAKAAEAAAELAKQTGLSVVNEGDDMTPEQAREWLAQRDAKLSAGAKKAWDTRRANGFDGKAAAKKSWDTRRAKLARIEALAKSA